MKKKIPEAEWRKVADMAVVAFERIEIGESPEDVTSEVFGALRKLATKYPFDSRPFSSMGDLSKDVNQSFSLYCKAYEMATRTNDYTEMVSTATSALRLSIETKRRAEVNRWKNLLLSIQHLAHDEWEQDEIKDLFRMCKKRQL